MEKPAATPPPTAALPTPGYRVALDAYAGPLDLLLYLVKRHEIDLHDIPVAKLTEQYLRHLEVIKQIDFESAGEFLVMAATLVEVKSRMIIPASDQAEAEQLDAASELEEAADPRFELVQQLLAYKAYKDAAYALDSRAEEWDNRFPVKAQAGERPPEPAAIEEKTIDLEDVNVLDLCEAFSRILETVGHIGDHQVTYDDTPISLHAEDIHDRLKRDAPKVGLSLREIFEGRETHSEMIGLFLATLELVRQHLVSVVLDATQDNRPGANVRLVLIAPEQREQDRIDADQPTDWTDPESGELQYTWPDEASKRRYERRQKLRATLEAKAQADQENAPSADPNSGQNLSDDDDLADDDEEQAGESSKG